jgi:uncharacterized membrane protein YgdD (TMEM256/DUF423 family)
MVMEVGYVVSPIAYFCFYAVVLLILSMNFLGSEYAKINVIVSLMVGIIIFCEKYYKLEDD